MIKAFSRWLFMRTHRTELLRCATYARQVKPSDYSPPFTSGCVVGMLDALEALGLLR